MPAEPVASAEPLLESDFQLNLDDLSLDADWDLVSPFRTDAPARIRDRAVEAPDEHFSSNLQELPEVFELDAEHEGFHDFGPRDGGNGYPLDASAVAPVQGDFEHLAGDPGNMAKLNQALAYIEQGNLAAACDILNEVIDQGDEQQRRAARQLLAEIA